MANPNSNKRKLGLERITLTILSLITLAGRRIWNCRLLILCFLLGMVVAVGLLFSVPLYTDAALHKLLQGELIGAGTHRSPFAFLWRYIGTWHSNIKWKDYAPVNAYLAEQAPSIRGLPVEFQVHHNTSDNLHPFPTENDAFSRTSCARGRDCAPVRIFGQHRGI